MATLPPVAHHEVAHVGERRAVQPPARQHGRPPSVLDRLRVGQVDEPVVGKARMQRDVHEAAVAVGSHPRHAGNRMRIELSVADDA